MKKGLILKGLSLCFFLFLPASIFFHTCLFSAEKTVSRNFAEILGKKIFFDSSDIKKAKESSILPAFVSQMNPPQPLDKIYWLVGTFSYTDEPEKSTAVFGEISSKKMIFLKKNDIVNGNRVLSIDDSGVVFESGLGDRFLFTQSGIKYTRALPQRFYFRVNMQNAIKWLTEQPEFLSTIRLVAVNGAGFSVQEIEQGSIFELAGLNKNDRIIQINNTFLTNTSDAISAYNEIFKTGKKLAVIRVLRSNKPVDLVYILE